MLLTITHDSARDMALAVAAAIPVVAVAFYAVRVTDANALFDGGRLGFDLPRAAKGRLSRGLISFWGRVPVADGKIWLGEPMLFAADAAFARSFAPGLLAALAGVVTDGDPRWLALSLLLLFGMIGQLVTYAGVLSVGQRASALLGRRQATALEAPRDGHLPAPARACPILAGRRARTWQALRGWWLRDPAASLGTSDVRPFSALAYVVVVHTLAVAVVTIGFSVVLLTSTRVI